MTRHAFILSLFLLLCGGAAFASETDDLVDLTTLAPHIRVEMPYATTQNFTHVAIYPIAKAFLHRPVAEALSKVQAALEKQDLGLKVWDAYRPLSVQKQFWKLVPDERYVASPVKGSRHNRAAAVDVTLVDSTGHELEMPTKFDDFTERAGAFDKEHTAAALAHRQTLQDAMLAGGFDILPTEWWHFDFHGWERYEILDIQLETLAGGSPSARP